METRTRISNLKYTSTKIYCVLKNSVHFIFAHRGKFLKNVRDEAHYFSGMDRYADFLRLKIQRNTNKLCLNDRVYFIFAHRDQFLKNNRDEIPKGPSLIIFRNGQIRGLSLT